MSEAQDYPLGYSAQEARRLAEQGKLLEEITAEVFRRAGLEAGMEVLDLGCGVGDVSLLASRIVGRQGTVLGIDRASASLEIARRRAAALGAANVRFEAADLAEFSTERCFDAIVGRLVLLYLPDPAAVLRRLSRQLRPGGMVAFLEYDITQTSQVPPSGLFTQSRSWLLQAFAAAGAQLDMGTQLYPTFLHAGLPPPAMSAVTPIACGPDTPGFEYLVEVLRSLLPFIERAGIATADQVGIETRAALLHADAIANERVTFLPRAVGAWTRIVAAVPP